MIFVRLCLLLGLTIAVVTPVLAGSWLDQFEDDDGWFDVSDWVLTNAAAVASVNLTFYDPAEGPIFADRLKFNAEVLVLQQPLSFRVGGSDLFLAEELEWMNVETSVDLGKTSSRGSKRFGLHYFIAKKNRATIARVFSRSSPQVLFVNRVKTLTKT